MLKKMMLLATAVAALAAFAIPATASANWTHSGSVLGANATIPLTGWAEFEIPSAGNSGIRCDVHAELEMTKGTTTGHVKKFEITTESCIGTVGFVACKLKADTTPGIPWLAHIVGGAIQITNIEITNEYSGVNCPLTTSVIKFPTALATPIGSKAAITGVTLSGTGTANGTEAKATGELSVVGGVSGTYGIE